MHTSIYMCILVYRFMCLMYLWSTLVMWLECRFLFGGGAADAGTAAPNSASVCWRHQNETWIGIDTNTN